MVDMFKSLEELENSFWGDPTYDSYLVRTCHHLRTLPLKDLSLEHLRMGISQDIGREYLIPIAIEKLKENPLAYGSYNEGELLATLIKASDHSVFATPKYKDQLAHLTELALNLLEGTSEDRWFDEKLVEMLERYLRQFQND